MFRRAWVRLMAIESATTPNPMSKMFTGPKYLEPGQCIDFPNVAHAYKSPLVAKLFEVSGSEVVRSVYITDKYLTVTLEQNIVKDVDATWHALTPKFVDTINSFVTPGDTTIQELLSSEGAATVTWEENDTEPQPEDTEVVLAIKELIASRIRPMLQGDGGNLKFVGLSPEGLVFVVLQGACVGCPSSGATLKDGIERMLMHWVPEVVEVQEVDEDFATDWKRTQDERKQKEQQEKKA